MVFLVGWLFVGFFLFYWFILDTECMFPKMSLTPFAVAMDVSQFVVDLLAEALPTMLFCLKIGWSSGVIYLLRHEDVCALWFLQVSFPLDICIYWAAGCFWSPWLFKSTEQVPKTLGPSAESTRLRLVGGWRCFLLVASHSSGCISDII